MSTNNATAFKYITQSNAFTRKMTDHNEASRLSRDVQEFIKRKALEEAYTNSETLTKEHIKKLEDKCMRQEIKLKNCIPISIILPLILCVSILAIILTLTIIQIVTNIKLIDYYILFYTLVIFTGLLHTSLAIIRGWKRYLNNE